MKCVRCGQDSKYKEREGGKCPKCQGEFAFEPRRSDPFTDAAFAHAIEVVSGQGAVRFDPTHVYYHLCRRPTSAVLTGIVLPAVAMVASCGVGVVLAHDVSLLLGALCGFAGLGLSAAWAWVAHRPNPTVRLSRASFDALWERWTRIHGAPKGVIQRVRKALPTRSAELEAELREYSFDRAVICDKPALVDVLVANRFHFENNCAILSVGGYPENAFETVRAMLRNNPRLVVLALHDCTPEGCTLAHRLAHDSAWFQGRARVIDVGLRPAQARSFSGLWQANQPTRAVFPAAGITEAEVGWLSAYTLEIAAIRPEQLIKRLYKAMVNAEAMEVSLDGGGGDGWMILSTDSGTTDGGGDSFG